MKCETSRLQQLITDSETEVNTLKQRLHDLQERCKFTETCLHETSAMLENTKSLVNEEKIKVGTKYLYQFLHQLCLLYIPTKYVAHRHDRLYSHFQNLI